MLPSQYFPMIPSCPNPPSTDEIEGETNTKLTVFTDSSSLNSSTEELIEQENQHEELLDFPTWVILPLFLLATLIAFRHQKESFPSNLIVKNTDK
jgi:hypothetical protein